MQRYSLSLSGADDELLLGDVAEEDFTVGGSWEAAVPFLDTDDIELELIEVVTLDDDCTSDSGGCCGCRVVVPEAEVEGSPLLGAAAVEGASLNWQL